MAQHIITRKTKFADAIVNDKYHVHRAVLSEHDYFEKLFNFPKKYEGLFPISIIGSDAVVNALLDTIYDVTPLLKSSDHVIEYLALCDSLFIRANMSIFSNHFLNSTYKEKCSLTELYVIDLHELYKTFIDNTSSYHDLANFETIYVVCMNPERFEKFVDMILYGTKNQNYSMIDQIIRIIGVYLCLSQPSNWKTLISYMLSLVYIRDSLTISNIKGQVYFPTGKPSYLNNFNLTLRDDNLSGSLYQKIMKIK